MGALEDLCLGCSGSLPLEDAIESTLPLCYRKISPRDPDHPLKAGKSAKRDAAKKQSKLRKNSGDYQRRAQLVKASQRNEQDTRNQIIRATVASGAVNGDGDSRIGDGSWGIDDKLKSTASKQFTVTTAEIDKASSQKSVIVITLASGRKFVVASLEDFCAATAALCAAVSNVTAPIGHKFPN